MVLKMYGKEVPMTIPAAVYLTRLVAYIANPLLYFKAKNGTRNVSKQASQISNATQKTINNDNTT
ncbi:hypothetical protein M3Y97_00647400 [Aphelenchoides bicaudatus]|nr:hypothetical protein M3Y97_00647400 [Aphelenchoides bicaudatus]